MARFQIRDLIWLTLVVALTLGLLSSLKYADVVNAKNQTLEAELTKFKTNELRLQTINTSLLEKHAEATRPRTIDDYLYNKGIALLALDRQEDAAASFEICIKYDPEDLLPLDHLIQIYRDIGDERQVEQLRKRRKEVVDKNKAELEQAYNRRFQHLQTIFQMRNTKQATDDR